MVGIEGCYRLDLGGGMESQKCHSWLMIGGSQGTVHFPAVSECRGNTDAGKFDRRNKGDKSNRTGDSTSVKILTLLSRLKRNCAGYPIVAIT